MYTLSVNTRHFAKDKKVFAFYAVVVHQLPITVTLRLRLYGGARPACLTRPTGTGHKRYGKTYGFCDVDGIRKAAQASIEADIPDHLRLCA